MASPIGARVHTVTAVHATAYRRVLPSSLEGLLEHLDMRDEMSLAIKHWYDTLLRASKLDVDITKVQKEFNALLKEILKDPLTQLPLDENPMLGSDGRTYSKQTLSIYSLAVSEEFKNRSPLEPKNPAPFTYGPHPIAKYMIDWLSGREIVVEIAGAGTPDEPSLSPSELERIARIREKHLSRRQRKAEGVERLAAERAAVYNNRVDTAAAAVAQKAIEDRERLQAEMALFREAQEADRARVRNEIDDLNKQIAELREQNAEYQILVGSVSDRIVAVEENDRQLQMLINEAAIAIKESKKNQFAGILEAAVIVGICVAVTLLLPPAPAAGGPAAHVSAIKGGAMLTFGAAF